ncbi:hypothetical protein ACFE04_011607 [Oxalis oulophora]
MVMMKGSGIILLLLLCSIIVMVVKADNPYRYFDWTITYGDIYPLGVRQRGILINGQFPGPEIYAVTNDNLVINVHNKLPNNEPFLLSWNGVQQRKNSYQDGVYGTTCPIPSGQNFTYNLQVKDQIGSFYYFPSLAFHKAAGGFGAIKVLSRPQIPVPFAEPAGDFSLLIGDWYKLDHQKLKSILDGGHRLPSPDGVLINGRGSGSSFTVDQGKTYRFRISNVGLQNSLNFRIQGHKMTNSKKAVSGQIPGGPTTQISTSLNQARSVRTNLTASGPRPNPQGSYHYGEVNVTRTIKLVSSAGQVDGKQRYAVNSVSFNPKDTPLKLADYYKIGGVFTVGSISDNPTNKPMYLDTSVMGADYHAFIEVVFENRENFVQSWHLDGYSFWVVGMDGGSWTTTSRNQYNLRDAISRSTVQVYPKSWSAIYVSLDNVGMWNLRTEFWARQYLGQQFYLRVYTTSTSLRDEYLIPKNALLCGKAKGQHTRSL